MWFALLILAGTFIYPSILPAQEVVAAEDPEVTVPPAATPINTVAAAASSNTVAAAASINTVAAAASSNTVAAATSSNAVISATSTNAAARAASTNAVVVAMETELDSNVAKVSDQRGSSEEDALTGAIEIKLVAAEAEAEASGKHERKKLLPFLFYASLRLHFINVDGALGLADGGSRIGAIWDSDLRSGRKFTARVEAGLDVVDSFQSVVTADASSSDGSSGNILDPRLYYAGIRQDDRWRAQIGKMWSIYYDVAGMTDSFIVYGGLASGTYNAGTDGGGSGTGRAENTVQFRFDRWGIHGGLQGQVNTGIPVFDGERYDYVVGASLGYSPREKIKMSFAYNRAFPEDISAEMMDSGYDGDDVAAAGAVRWRDSQWLFATSFAMTDNHDTDNEAHFIDAWGWEMYGRCSVIPRIRVVGGWNIQKPRDSDYEGEFYREDYIVGAQLAFKNHTFSDMLYVEYKLDLGRNADGSERDNSIAVGVRYKLTW